MDRTPLTRSSSEEIPNQQPTPVCDYPAYNEWVRTAALRVLQIAAQGFSYLSEVKKFPVSNIYTDVKALEQGVGATFAGFDLISVARGVKESWEECNWSSLTFNHLPNGLLALSSIRVVAWRTDLLSAIPMPSALSKGVEFLGKYISQDYLLFAAGLSASCFHIKASVSEITSLTDRSKLGENRPHVLRIIANVTLTAYHALGLRSAAPSSLKMGLLVASTACTLFAGPVKPGTPTDDNSETASETDDEDDTRAEDTPVGDTTQTQPSNKGNGGTCTIL